ncbi:hypothetical protein LTR66_010735 [Elasticomyces elasticus]|nr:hypothetical protein LTR66_010735 [Elasticomyces elasticus]
MAGSLHSEEMIYGTFDDAFESVVSLANSILHYESGGPLAENFSIEMGIIQPLYAAATKCRKVQIRKQALQLLSAVPHPEGIWNGKVMAMIAKEVKQIKEGLDELFLGSHRIPESHRTHVTDMNTDPKARCSVFSCRSRPNGVDGEWEDQDMVGILGDEMSAN